MSSISNRGFARIRTQVLISLAALSMVTAVSASTSPASAFALGGRSFGGLGHAMGGHSFRGLVIALSPALSMAAGLAQTSEPAPAPQAPSAKPSIHSDREKTCMAWTDRCRICERGDDDTVHCSNIGIACQAAEITCSRRSQPAK